MARLSMAILHWNRINSYGRQSRMCPELIGAVTLGLIIAVIVTYPDQILERFIGCLDAKRCQNGLTKAEY